MKIWFFNHYATTPDQPMTGAYYLARALVGLGHDVRVFASSFSYYRRKEIRLSLFEFTKETQCDGIIFNWIRTTSHSSWMVTRLINMISYMLNVFVVSALTRERPDVVIGTNPHLFGAVSALFIAKIRGAKFVYEVRDLWPQHIVDSGGLSPNSLVTRIFERIETLLFEKADLIVSVLPFVGEHLEERNIDLNKWICIQNGIDVETFPLLEPPRVGDSDDITFMYVGGHARYQGLDTILIAAKKLQDEDIKGIRFIFVGDGVMKQNLIGMAEQLQLTTVEFRDAVPRNQVPEQLEQATVALFHILPLPVLRFGASPNKLCDYMIAGRPVLCAGELRNNPVKDADAGICIDSQSPEQMVFAIKQFLSMQEDKLQSYGKRARKYACSEWDCRTLAMRFEARLNRLFNKKADSACKAA